MHRPCPFFLQKHQNAVTGRYDWDPLKWLSEVNLGRTKKVKFFSFSPAVQVDPVMRGVLARQRAIGGITVLLAICTVSMASNSSLRVVEACSCRIKTPVLLLHVIFKQCAPVLGDKCVNRSQGEVREEILDCVLKIWVRSDTPALGFLFSPRGHSCSHEQTHREFFCNRVCHQPRCMIWFLLESTS